MIDTMVVERRELDNSFSWMSTLGGAYSALGDYIPNFVSITYSYYLYIFPHLLYEITFTTEAFHINT